MGREYPPTIIYDVAYGTLRLIQRSLLYPLLPLVGNRTRTPSALSACPDHWTTKGLGAGVGIEPTTWGL